eukprot:m.235311 g.235311  ORF g.235311 m.235311 type:complete len:516 (-) comp19334_c0_seq2:40-1587(-)
MDESFAKNDGIASTSSIVDALQHILRRQTELGRILSRRRALGFEIVQEFPALKTRPFQKCGALSAGGHAEEVKTGSDQGQDAAAGGDAVQEVLSKARKARGYTGHVATKHAPANDPNYSRMSRRAAGDRSVRTTKTKQHRGTTMDFSTSKTSHRSARSLSSDIVRGKDGILRRNTQPNQTTLPSKANAVHTREKVTSTSPATGSQGAAAADETLSRALKLRRKFIRSTRNIHALLQPDATHLGAEQQFLKALGVSTSGVEDSDSRMARLADRYAHVATVLAETPDLPSSMAIKHAPRLCAVATLAAAVDAELRNLDSALADLSLQDPPDAAKKHPDAIKKHPEEAEKHPDVSTGAAVERPPALRRLCVRHAHDCARALGSACEAVAPSAALVTPWVDCTETDPVVPPQTRDALRAMEVVAVHSEDSPGLMALMASLHATQLEIYNLEIAQNVQELLRCMAALEPQEGGLKVRPSTGPSAYTQAEFVALYRTVCSMHPDVSTGKRGTAPSFVKLST